MDQTRLIHARVLCELGDIYDAEREVAAVLEEHPESLDALNLFAKIKHIRGELSQAILCWAQIYTLSKTIGSAQLTLKSIMQLALDPERGAGEFLALGQYQLAKKPTAHLELEEAFGLYLARKPKEARARCEEIAARHRGREREVFKLAVLASAWFAELSGDLDGASSTLEWLGEERSFATDVDRVQALARVYEKMGTPKKLEAAIHIYRYLHAQFDTLTPKSQLATLHRRLGHHQLAEEYEREYEAAFRRRMNRPTLEEVVRFAGARYLPIPRLLEIRFPEQSIDTNLMSRRELALADALRGDRIGARVGFGEGRDLLDEKYLTDLTLLAGDVESAIDLYLGILRRDPTDLAILSWLLDLHRATPSPAVAAYFHQKAALLGAKDVLERAIERAPTRPSLWHRLASLLSLHTDFSEEAFAAGRRADAHEAAHVRTVRPLGRVLAPAIYQFMGKQKGLIHEVWADREIARPGFGGTLPPDQILGNVSDDLRRSIQSIFVSVREYARTKFPHLTEDIDQFTYRYKMTKEDEPSHGVSAGLPSALAFLSVFLQRPVPQNIASTGMIVTDAHDVLSVRGIGHAEQKVKAAYHRNLRFIILPLENRAEVEANPRLPKSVRDEIVRYVNDLDDAVRWVFGPDLFMVRLVSSNVYETSSTRH
jgi:tetratricopeptide (TPR) repeat protein